MAEGPPPVDALPPWLLPEPPDLDVATLPPDPFCAPAPTSTQRLRQALDEPEFGPAAALISSLDPTDLDAVGRVNYLSLTDRLERQAAALRVRGVAALAGPAPVGATRSSSDFVDCEVAAALELSPPAGARQVHAARQLSAYLPATFAALSQGAIGYLQALTITEHSYVLDPDLLPRFEDVVVAKAVGRSPGQVRALARKTIARLAPDALAARERQAREAADVTVAHGDDGTAQVWAEHVPSADAAVIEAALDGYARSRKARGDERTLGQLRVAALVQWATVSLAGPGAPTNHGRPYRVNVTLDLPTFLGLTDQPAEVTGGGIIPAHVARQLVRDARLRRLIIDPASGHLLDYGRKTYRVPADLADAIAARYVTTTGPGTTPPARTGDQDHDLPWQQGGLTNPDNLHPAGRRHHNAKTRAGWTTHICTCGTVTWRTTKGASYRVEPHDYRLGP